MMHGLSQYLEITEALHPPRRRREWRRHLPTLAMLGLGMLVGTCVVLACATFVFGQELRLW